MTGIATSFASDACIDGIYYNLVSKVKTAEVTSENSSSPYYNTKPKGSIVIPETVTYEGVKYTVTSIGKRAFYCCLNITSVTIPNTVTSIGEDAFYGCKDLSSVNISNSITCIDEYVFSGCSNLASISIPNSVTNIGKCAFEHCSGLTSITIPNSVTSIGEWVFHNCSNITSITVPNSIKKIGGYTFYDCTGLKSIIIPSSLTNIGTSAFANCKNIEDVYCYAENVPNMSKDVFKDAYIEYATLHVPEGSVDLYKSAEQWKDFGTIVGFDATSIGAISNISSNNKDCIYSLDGKRQVQLNKGFNIVNGKKIFVSK